MADNLANMVIVAGVCKGLFKMPDWVVFGRILPGLGLSLLLGLSFYTWLGRRLAIKEGRDDVTALPYGISTPVMFVYLFGVIAPVYFSLLDRGPDFAGEAAWRVGLAAAFLGGAVEALGSVLGPYLKKVTPRAGMLGTLAGIALVWIAAIPLASIFEDPLVGFPALALVIAGLVAGVRLPFGVPAGLAALGVGVGIGLLTGSATWDPAWRPALYPPIPVLGDLLEGFRLLWQHPTVLAVILPIEIANFLETMNNVESAEAAGDTYDVRTCQIADGIGTMVGTSFGGCFPTTVFIGHPAYKRLGSRLGYTLGVGITLFLVVTLGMQTLLYGLIPRAAVDPLLVFVGMVIVAQAFSGSPKRHSMAVAIALIPHLHNVLSTKLTGVLNEAKVAVTDELSAGFLRNQGIHWEGINELSQGAIVTGLIWGAAVAYTIDHRFGRAAAFMAGGCLLTLVGVIHSPNIAWNPEPIAWGYLMIALIFAGLSLRSRPKEFDDAELE